MASIVAGCGGTLPNLQAHTASVGWDPASVPALWTLTP